jgi:hypothetical protein
VLCCNCCVSFRNKTVETLASNENKLLFNQNNYCRTRFWLLAFISDTRLNRRALVPLRPNPANKCNNNRRAGLQSGIRGPTQVRFCTDSDLISKNQRIGCCICAAAAEQVVQSTAEQTRERWSIESRTDAASATQSESIVSAVERVAK